MPGPPVEDISKNWPSPRFQNNWLGCLNSSPRLYFSTNGYTWPSAMNRSGQPSLSKSRKAVPHFTYWVCTARPVALFVVKVQTGCGVAGDRDIRSAVVVE